MSEMTDQEIIIAVAKLKGNIFIPQKQNPNLCFECGQHFQSHYQGYCVDTAILTSRDAIIPVIEKQEYTKDFMDFLWVEIGNSDFSKSREHWDYGDSYDLIFATPRQLCIALLKATGNWRSE